MTASSLFRQSSGPAMALVLFMGSLSAQTKGGTQTPPATGGGATPTPTMPTNPTRPSTTTTPSTTNTTTTPTTTPDMSRPIFLSGRVMMEDGTPPPESVTIERVCSGSVRPEAHTDGKGHFSFQLGENQHIFADASVSSQSDVFDRMGGGSSSSATGSRGISERDLMNCELRASLPGYRSSVVSLAGRRVMDNPEVGTILLHYLGKVEGYTVSATTAMAPKDAKKAFEKGVEAAKKKKLPEAQKELEKSVDIYPKFAAAWFNLGLVRERQKDIEGARKAYAQSLVADSKYVNPYMQLAQIAVEQKNWKDVADSTDRLLKLNPYDFPRAHFLNAVAYLNLQNLDAAEKSARSTIKNDPDNRIPKVHHLLGVILAQKQEYPEAATELKSYLKLAPTASDIESVRKQLTEIEKVTGKQETAEKNQ